MRIDVVAWGDAIGGLSFKSGRKNGNITAKAFEYSEPVRYTGPSLLAIHQTGDADAGPEEPPMSEEDKEHELIPLPAVEIENSGGVGAPVPEGLAKRREKEPTLIALVPLPPEARHVTVLLAPAAEGTYQGYVINDDPAKLPFGKLRVHNLSPFSIAMQFAGGEQQEMKPRGNLLVDAPDGHAIYQLAYRQDDDWKIQENNIVPVDPREQVQLIVLKSNNRFFLSSDGASGGFLQMVTLRRRAE